MIRLNGWQRLWVVCSVVSLIAAVVIGATSWPARDPQVTAQFASDECRPWLALPAGFVPDIKPGEPCEALQRVMFESGTTVRSASDYERWLSERRTKAMMPIALGWISAIAVLYAIGWSVAWIRRGFAQRGA